VKSQCKQCNSDFWRQNGRKRWKFECLQACRLSEPIVCTSNMMFLTSHRIQNTSNEAWKQAKSKKRPKSADLVVLRLSQREKIEKTHYLQEEAIFFKILSTAFLSTWMQTYLRPASLNVDLVRRTSIFCVFLVLGGPKNGTVGEKKSTKTRLEQKRLRLRAKKF
jgi:hypothetical protein